MESGRTKLQREISNKPLLILIRGLPGSGKSTMAETLANHHHTSDWFEADMYFEGTDGTYKFNPKQLGDAHDWCHESVSEAMARHSPVVIVSNTFTQNWEMEEYLAEAESYGYEVQVIHMERNFGSKHNVPEKTIQKMQDRWEPYAPRRVDSPYISFVLASYRLNGARTHGNDGYASESNHPNW